MTSPKATQGEPRIVITPAERQDGSAMQQDNRAVRDLKLIYPETGFDARTLCLGVVEIDPGHHSPLHRHRCEEVYYVVRGSGELESNGQRYPLSPGCAVLNRPDVLHRVHNTGSETLQLIVVAGIRYPCCRSGRRHRPTRCSRGRRPPNTRQLTPEPMLEVPLWPPLCN